MHKNTMMKKALKNKFINWRDIIIIIFTILLIISLHPINILLASDYKTGNYLKSWPVNKGDKFHIKYIHSVQLVPVTEIYSIDDKNNIILEESYFHSYGAGLPANTPYEFEMTEKGFRIYNINKKIDNLIYRTGAIRANHKIYIKDQYYPFLNFSERKTGVKFQAKKTFFIKYLVREVFK